MEQLLGNVANNLFGVPVSRTPNYLSEHRTDFVPQPGQTAYGFTFDWGPALGHHSRVSVGYFATAEEAEDALAAQLIAAGYEEPHWWQFWRWGSTKLPPQVQTAIRKMRESV